MHITNGLKEKGY